MHPETKIHFSLGKHVVLPGKITEIEQDARNFYSLGNGMQPVYFIEGDGHKDEFESIQRYMREGRPFLDALVNTWSVINRKRPATASEVSGEIELMTSQSRGDFRYAEYLMIDRLARLAQLVYTGEMYPRGNKRIFLKDRENTYTDEKHLEGYLKSGNIKKAVSETRSQIQKCRFFRGERDSLITDQIIQAAQIAENPSLLFVRYGIQHSSLVDNIKNLGIVDVSVTQDAVDLPSFLWEDYIAHPNDVQLDLSDEQIRLVILDSLIGSAITYFPTINSLDSGKHIHNKIRGLSPDQVNSLLKEFAKRTSTEILANFM